jgi:hypothetical protein
MAAARTIRFANGFSMNLAVEGRRTEEKKRQVFDLAQVTLASPRGVEPLTFGSGEQPAGCKRL